MERPVPVVDPDWREDLASALLERAEGHMFGAPLGHELLVYRLFWGYRCPVCGQALATIGGLTLGTEGCPICASWPPGSGTAAASATRAGQRARERRPRAGALRRVHLLAEGDRLILVKARFPRLVELVPLRPPGSGG